MTESSKNETCWLLLRCTVIALSVIIACYVGFRIDTGKGFSFALILFGLATYAYLCTQEAPHSDARRNSLIVIPIWMIILSAIWGWSMSFGVALWGIPVFLISGLILLQSFIDMANADKEWTININTAFPIRMLPSVLFTIIGWFLTIVLPEHYHAMIWLGTVLGSAADMAWHLEGVFEPTRVSRNYTAYVSARGLSLLLFGYGLIGVELLDAYVGAPEATLGLCLAAVCTAASIFAYICVIERNKPSPVRFVHYD